MKLPQIPTEQRANVRHGAYGSSALRAPSHDPISVVDAAVTAALQTRYVPVARDADLTSHGAAAPMGERIIVTGRVTDEDGQALPHSLVEIWQCGATGRYMHQKDQHDAPLDPHFPGHGRCLTDAQGNYRFVTIKPGAYPWRNHANAWRPAHIHFSLFGNIYAQRLITQMYFPNDPLFEFDPIFQSVPDPAARERMVSRFDVSVTQPEWALGYRFDIVLRGANATPFEA